MSKFKCHNCGRQVESDKLTKDTEWVCTCGAVNVVPLLDGTGDDAVSCLAPTGFEWQLPSGVLEGPRGKIYITAQGTQMTKDEFMTAFKVDPDLALEYMRKLGEEGKPGFFNTSTLGRKKK